MKFLIDTNILISLEPAGASEIEVGATEVAEVAKLIQQSRNQVVVHPLVLADIARDANAPRRQHRQHVLGKYSVLDAPPQLTADDEAALGIAPPGSNDWVDNHLVVAVARDSVDCVITQDQGIHRKAAKLGLADRVLTTRDALTMLRALFDTVPTPPPAVRVTKAHNLDERDPIFESFRADYPGFDIWLRKCKLDGRPAWTIDGQPGLAAMCIVNPETDSCYGMNGKILKICSFKVSEAHIGARLGELLLKAVFKYAHENAFDWLYVTAFEKHAWLLALFHDFGFVDAPNRSPRGELVLIKPTRPDGAGDGMSALDYAIRYGPFYWSRNIARAWVVPIQPRYDSVLFPERQEQASLFAGRLPFGNAIRKAYLCRSPVRGITPGDVMAFYRSETSKSIRTLGIVENWITSHEPEKISQYVARRTVYSMQEITVMCSAKRPVLAIRFRQVLHEFHEIPLGELKASNVLRGPPQSIVRILPERIAWLMDRVA
jgi:hypothetical protein